MSSKKQDELMILDGQFAVLGTPAKDSCTFAWVKGLPFFDMFYGKDGHRLPANDSPEWPPKRLRGCPPQLVDFLAQTLQWRPCTRLMAAPARMHSFINSEPLSVTIPAQKAKNGLATIAKGFLDEDVLDYLQKCPTWPQRHEACRRNDFLKVRPKVSPMKCEFVGYIDAKSRPKCMSLNSDTKLPPIPSARLAMFVKAFRRGAKA